MVSRPRAPDPYATAAAQAQMNKETAVAQQELNMVNQNGPWGNVSYQQTGTSESGTPLYTQTTNLSPSQQAIFDQSQAAMGNMAEIANKQTQAIGQHIKGGLDFSSLPGLTSDLGLQTSLGLQTDPGLQTSLGLQDQLGLATNYAGVDDFSADRQRVEDALWDRTAGDRSAADANMRSTLAAKGIREGSAAWDAEMERMSRQNTDARLATIMAGGQEQSRLVGLARDAALFGNDALLAEGSFANTARAAEGQFGNASRLAGAQFGNDARLAEGTFGNAARVAQGQFGNAARGQALNEQVMGRNQPINELTALLGGTQVQAPGQTMSAAPQTSVDGVNMMGMVQNNYEQQMSGYNSMLGGIGGLFGLALGPQGFLRGA